MRIRIRTRSALVFLMLVLLVFSTVFAVTAADATATSTEEATMTVTKNGETTTRSGSFDSFILELDSQETSESENAVYSIVINEDFTVGGKGWWELKSMSPTATLNIDLNGHTVTATKGNVIQVRTGYKLNIDGADENGNAGTWIATGSAASMFFPRDVDTQITVKDINIVSTNLSQEGQPVLHLMKGEVTMSNVRLTYTGASFPSSGVVEEKSLIKIGNGKITLNNCVLEDKSDGKLKFSAMNTYSSVTATANNTSFDSYYGFKGTANIKLDNSTVKTTDYIFSGTCSATVTDSELTTAKSTFSSTTGAVRFNYGTGKNVVTIASGSYLTDSVVTDDGYTFISMGNGKYVLVPESAEEITVTTMKNGALTTKSCSFDSFILELDGQETSESENAVYSIVINKDFTVGGKGWWELKSMSPTATLNIDLNGHTVTATKGNVIQVRTAYTLNIDGADEAGKRGTWIATGSAASMFYMQKSAGTDAVANIENVDIVCTNLSDTTQPILHLASGTTTMKNVSVTYTGTAFPSNGTVEDKAIIKLAESAKLVLENCTLEDTSNGTLKFYAINATSKASFKLDGITVKSYYGFTGAAVSNVIENSKIVTVGDAFLGSIACSVTDTEISTVNSTFTSSAGKISFNCGTGKTSVTIASGNELSGNIDIEEGYAFIPCGNGKYTLGSDEGVSTVEMTSIYSDGMIFQREMPINIFGTCRKVGAEIKVTLGGEEVIAVVDSTGSFKATFPARAAEKGLTLTVEQLGVDVAKIFTYNDIAIGEVIVISGQSNAAYEVYKMEDAAEYIANADNYSNIKVFRSPRKYEFYEVSEGLGSWHTVTSDLLKKSSSIGGDVSAIGYVLATRMADELGNDMPIALIDAAYAGAGIYPWIEYNTFVEKFGSTAYSNVQTGIKRYQDYVSFYRENGRYPASTSELSTYVEKPYTHTPGVCYNTMIAPIEGYSARCVVWYQGETNSSNLKDTYGVFFDALKETYKKAFSNEDLKFFAVQLAPYTSDNSVFRATQYDLGEASDTFVISTAREGSVMTESDLEQGYVHPARKSPVGHRLADSVLKNVYGLYEDEVVEAPRVISVTLEENKIVVTFDTDLYLSYGNVALGFEIAGADKKFKSADGEISENKITLSADGVDEPMYVRYGFGTLEFVLDDGTVLSYNPALSNSIDSEKAVVIGPDGTQYVFEGGCGTVVESKFQGNLTNESGHPMPTFMLAVGFSE